MKILKIDAAVQLVSRWSGGTTTQLAICPRGASYADRDFLWRLSSAVVELPESDFTPLPDYDRILMILEGELALSHDGGEEYILHALEQTAFDGASRTFSRGEVTDFNLMMRKGRCQGRVDARNLRDGDVWENAFSVEFGADSRLLYCFHGSVDVTVDDAVFHIADREALLMEVEDGDVALPCMVQGGAAVIAAEMKTRRVRQ